MNENDLRVQRTRSLLRQALIDLVQIQGYEAISVRDITKKAQVGYKTFYRHYDGKEALLQALVNSIIGEFQEMLLPPSDAKASQQNTLNALSFAEQHAELLLTLLNSSASNQLLEAAVSVGMEEGRQTFYTPDIPQELVAHHFTSSMLSLMRWWVEFGKSYSKEEMTNYIHQLLILPMKRLSE